MKNADKPAYPANPSTKLNGLTKREAFAIAAMQGFLSNEEAFYDYTGEEIVELSVHHADALLEEFERTKQENHE